VAWKRAVTALLILSGLLSLGYIGISSYIAEQLVYEAPKAIVKTPAISPFASPMSAFRAATIRSC